ncbi:unnamed protein product [Candida verbasci]|uniref:Uncharacterized protein n=1 Tax=Candida verbasci TaxID=1227364 RepID=A0A9W4TVJ0_9ASCO|nr:unnamed protein product [Candida verbasci]
MIPTRILLNVPKTGAKPLKYPVEMTPLFAAVGVAIASGFFFTYRHFSNDKELRVWKNPNLSNLDDVLDHANREKELQNTQQPKN